MSSRPRATTQFDSEYKKLNPEQRAAVDAIEGPVMVIAGPGTGKTQVLTMRIANIRLKTDTPPEAILALTFTESGVASMRKRLSLTMGPDAYRVRIATFHGFANDIIKNRPDEFPHIIGATNITDVDQIRLIREIIDELPLSKLKPFHDRYFYLRAITSAIHELKREGIGPEAFEKIVIEEEKSFRAIPDLHHEKGAHKGKMKGVYIEQEKYLLRNKDLVTVYGEYQSRLRAMKWYDYTDMIMEVVSALEHSPDLLRTLQEEYLYILVDEHQDTNNAQNKIIELLGNAYDEPNIFVVGDEKQAIFRFQGASLENFLYFKNLYKNVHLITLTKNYRSTQSILDAAHSLTPEKTALRSEQTYPEKPVVLAAFSNPEVEHYFLTRHIAERITNGAKHEEIAILYRDNKDATPIARALEKAGIPFAIESDQDVLHDEDIKKLLHILKAIQLYGRDEMLVPLLHIDFLELPPLDVYKLSSAAQKLRTSIYSLITNESRLASLDLEAPQKFIALSHKLSSWRTGAQNKNAADAFEIIIRESGFLAHILNSPAMTEKIAKLHTLFDQIKSLLEAHRDYALANFFEYLDILRENEVLVKTAVERGVPGRLRLMTGHRAKGLEFDYVYIVGASDGHWGNRHRAEHVKLPTRLYQLIKDAHKNTEQKTTFEEGDDERNLFYVALTRAKREAVIVYAERTMSGREQLPSQFVIEIKPECIEKTDTLPYEKSFAEHRENEFAAPPEKPNALEDKAFLNHLFREQVFSPTALNNYLECPWRYFYRNLIRIPEAPEKSLSYGMAVHAALKYFFDARTEGEHPDESYLLARFSDALAHEPLNQADYDESLAKGRKSLGGWYDAYQKTWTHRTSTEVPIIGIKLNDITIGGKIDKIEFLDNGQAVNIVDYKTGKPKSRNEIEGQTKTSDGNYKRQLVFYNLLLNRDGRYSMQSGEIDFIEPDIKNKYHKEIFHIAPQEVTALEEQIGSVAQEILDLAFWDKKCDDPDCEYCALRALMG